MRIHAAVVLEQGVRFVVIEVKADVMRWSEQRKAALISDFGRHFPGCHVVLGAHHAHGRHEYFGRKDIANFLASVEPRRLPWAEYSLAA